MVSCRKQAKKRDVLSPLCCPSHSKFGGEGPEGSGDEPPREGFSVGSLGRIRLYDSQYGRRATGNAGGFYMTVFVGPEMFC